jgi:ribosomal protein L37AE/L43A
MAVPRRLDDQPAGSRPVRRVRRRDHLCPSCGSGAVDRTQRHGALERLYLTLANQRPYRCRECDHRFYDRPL